MVYLNDSVMPLPTAPPLIHHMPRAQSSAACNLGSVHPLCRVAGGRPAQEKPPLDLHEYLRRVDERLADCALRIAHYESSIGGLPPDGPEFERAATLIGALRHAEQMHREHRARLLAKITEQEAASAVAKDSKKSDPRPPEPQ